MLEGTAKARLYVVMDNNTRAWMDLALKGGEARRGSLSAPRTLVTLKGFLPSNVLKNRYGGRHGQERCHS